MNQNIVNYKAYKVHGTDAEGKSITEYPARHNWEDVELDIQRARAAGHRHAIIYAATEIRSLL